jgi:hypothetical protein
MTKKFWNDWRGRIGETKEIYPFYDYGDGIHHKDRYRGILNGGKILWVVFPKGMENEKAIVKVKRVSPRIIGKTSVEVEYHYIYRKDIATIEFIPKD